jgi:predicted Fe-Mo cluster-binding NifX family protein
MNVAIPLFGSRISPRFDFCQEMLIVTIDRGRVTGRKTVSVSTLAPLQRIADLCNRNVNAVICGGINNLIHSHLRNNGISVIYDVMGEADEALDRYLAGQLQPRTRCEGRRRKACRKGTRPPWQFSPSSKNRVGPEKEGRKK